MCVRYNLENQATKRLFVFLPTMVTQIFLSILGCMIVMAFSRRRAYRAHAGEHG